MTMTSAERRQRREERRREEAEYKAKGLIAARDWRRRMDEAWAEAGYPDDKPKPIRVRTEGAE